MNTAAAYTDRGRLEQVDPVPPAPLPADVHADVVQLLAELLERAYRRRYLAEGSL